MKQCPVCRRRLSLRHDLKGKGILCYEHTSRQIEKKRCLYKSKN